MIGIAIIGYGYMGKYHRIKVDKMASSGGVFLKSVYDTDEIACDEAIKDGLVVVSSMEEILVDDDVKLVVIATPNSFHYQQARLCLMAGKHVLSEKPATLSLIELEELVSMASDRRLMYTCHHNRRWDSDFSVVQKVIRSGEIGDVTTIWSETFGQRGICFGWRADPAYGGGMLYDWGIHLIDQILVLFAGKKVRSVMGRLRSILTPAVDDYFEIELEFEDDITAHITMGTFSLIDKPRWFLMADRGTLRLDDFSGTYGGIAKIKDNIGGFSRISKSTSVGPSRTLAHLEYENFEKICLPLPDHEPEEFYRNLIASVRGEEKAHVTSDEMLRDMYVLEKVKESNRCNQRIEVYI